MVLCRLWLSVTPSPLSALRLEGSGPGACVGMELAIVAGAGAGACVGMKLAHMAGGGAGDVGQRACGHCWAQHCSPPWESHVAVAS